jgi:hypothetical protein
MVETNNRPTWSRRIVRMYGLFVLAGLVSIMLIACQNVDLLPNS